MIGVFDSGSGGLTVLRALTDALPDRRFVYLGDHANAPYGQRSADDVYRLTIANVERLFAWDCRLVLLACNTASAVALRRLQQHWLPDVAPDRRVLGVLVPMVEAIARVPWQVQAPPSDRPTPPATVGVFATPRTVATGAYPSEIGRRAPAVQVVQQACPGLVAAIESDAGGTDLQALIDGYTAELLARMPDRSPDSVVLGCTHYPLAADAFARALPAGIPILDQPAIVARSLVAYLDRHGELDDSSESGDPIRLLSTGSGEASDAVASRFFGKPVTFASAG